MYNILRVMKTRRDGIMRVADISRELHASPSLISMNLKHLAEMSLVRKLDWGQYQVTLRGQLLVDILGKQDWSDEELLRYWVKAVIKPRFKDMAMAAEAIEEKT